ncbi:zinc-domain-containing protein [Nitrososphaera viennensis]|uniref:Zinc-domain-containing protein n=2 Tax=Nitrososphaera viennensis TaxID=1034015 RepID=A0A977IDD7_9ARCH|nr:zinc-domain-containing protein [Nitrososphaera viennensis]AIC16807.1 putative zinc-domain protein [Nitrososphaera viennensis EN76]UVS68712.1 zinc-domain-containing protein [Nitrososphaera viennensis]
MLEAKCPKCGKKAQVDDDMANVRCDFCGYSATYDEYIELMKGKAVTMADDYQMNWDKNPF